MDSSVEAPYSNRELRATFNDIIERCERIERQTTKTNGRVAMLEKWRWMVVGFCAGAAIFLSYFVVPEIRAIKEQHITISTSLAIVEHTLRTLGK